MKTHTIKLADFVAALGERWSREFGKQGQEWAEDYLVPAFACARDRVVIDLDLDDVDLCGARSIPYGFVGDALGHATRAFASRAEVMSIVKIECRDNYAILAALEAIRHANVQRVLEALRDA